MNLLGVDLGHVQVSVAKGHGLNAEEITDLCMRSILFVSADTPPVIRDQALAYRDRIRAVVLRHVEQAQKSAMTTALARLEQAGMPDAARVLRGN